MDASDVFIDLAPVDVELFVSSGVPRQVFSVIPKQSWRAPTVPTFRLHLETLRQLGWQVHGRQLRGPNDHEVDLGTPHPYDLGPMWAGGNCWRAEFRIKGSIVLALVDHRWNDPLRHECHLGTELASGSPWRWHIIGLEGGDRCGRAETPVLAAFAAESIVVAAGATIDTRTAIRRNIPD